jgi:hypothetical protein
VADTQITCINKADRQSTHEGITHLGGAGRKWTRDQVIASIEARSNTFFVTDGQGRRADVKVVDPGGGRRKYVQTYADGRWTNNLLSLPECP